MRHLEPRLELGVVIAVLLASLAAGFTGGLLVWVLWRFDLLSTAEGRPLR
ncbi:MAG TPA: hypothetical protein VHZ49_15290 [Methylomirabilota bacterium]|nr:hypothetical protein [Methylomirabilota bacterium]